MRANVNFRKKRKTVKFVADFVKFERAIRAVKTLHKMAANGDPIRAAMAEGCEVGFITYFRAEYPKTFSASSFHTACMEP